MPDPAAPADSDTLDLFDRADAADPSPRAAALMAPLPDLDASLIHEARPGYGEPPAPFYASPDSTLRLYQADALDLLRRMRGESVDMVFADPPYFLSNGGITCVGGRMVKVDKGGWDKSAGITGDHNFNLLWLDQCRRLLQAQRDAVGHGNLAQYPQRWLRPASAGLQDSQRHRLVQSQPAAQFGLPLLHPRHRDHFVGRQKHSKAATRSTTPK